MKTIPSAAIHAKPLASRRLERCPREWRIKDIAIYQLRSSNVWPCRMGCCQERACFYVAKPWWGRAACADHARGFAKRNGLEFSL